MSSTPQATRRMSRMLKRQTIVEDTSPTRSPVPKPVPRQNTLTVPNVAPVHSSDDEMMTSSMSRPLSGLSVPNPSPPRSPTSPNGGKLINLSKSHDHGLHHFNAKEAAKRWRQASTSFDRSDPRPHGSSRLSGRRPRASAFRLGASSSISASPRDSMSLSRDSNKSPHLSPRQRAHQEKSLSTNSSGSSTKNKSPKILVQTSSEMSGDSPSVMHRPVGPVAALGNNPNTTEEATKSPDSPQRKFTNYQIMAVRKGVPDIIRRDPQGKKYSIIHKDINITPYCICQRNNKESQKKPTAWVFSIFTTVICVLFPLTSFAADVAFYVVCSNHYNYTAQLLANVTATHFYVKPTVAIQQIEIRHSNEAGHVLAASPIQNNLYTTKTTPSMFPPAPLMASASDLVNKNLESVNQPAPLVGNNTEGNLTSNSIFTVDKSEGVKDIPTTKPSVEMSDFNVSVCADRKTILDYMVTKEAAEELEHHRHITIDIFEPVFILGSFPSLLLCILTRVVVIITGHDHFVSAYFINMACLPLQLATGALSVYSTSYQLGQIGFACWNCAAIGDCSKLGAFSWLSDEVTQALLASLITKLLDGCAGGVVLFIVLMRWLWKRNHHVTIWWYVIRGLSSVLIFGLCLGVGALLVLTPALAVIRMKFLEHLSKFPSYDNAMSVVLVLLGIGLAAWCLSCGLLLIYLIYNCYIYCRIKEHQ